MDNRTKEFDSCGHGRRYHQIVVVRTSWANLRKRCDIEGKVIPSELQTVLEIKRKEVMMDIPCTFVVVFFGRAHILSSKRKAKPLKTPEIFAKTSKGNVKGNTFYFTTRDQKVLEVITNIFHS